MQSRRSTLDETAERVAIAFTKARSDVAQRPTKRQYSFACVSVDVVGRRHTPFGEIIGDPLFFFAIYRVSLRAYPQAKRRKNRMLIRPHFSRTSKKYPK